LTTNTGLVAPRTTAPRATR